MDSQALLPPHWLPAALRDMRAWYAETMQDPLMHPQRPAEQLVWFRAFVTCEIFFQLPLMILALYAFHQCTRTGNDQVLRRWRLPLFAYAVHTATTLAPTLGELLVWPTADASDIAALRGDAAWPVVITPAAKLTLFGFYLPYLFFPLLLVWRLLPLFNDTAAEQRKKQ
ncbi:transmembrane protein 6/97 [Thamnocephalis sphaerospora]|uniref:Efficient mitochondria targeting-associated protein 19 n=1 Tax=Thamnocephalis sphaerospora TaxID=78915 RepID=A0A4P9XMR7_9FUNG|nr:transmembrane protein 6/97 [Thamnocephalis sphaerospora]|eukprot:RKP06681.1 transmembrane protein 6/97 [Thamnocephalis sphaerospora]